MVVYLLYTFLMFILDHREICSQMLNNILRAISNGNLVKYLTILVISVFLIFSTVASAKDTKEKVAIATTPSTTSILDKAVKEVLEPKKENKEEPKLFDIYAATSERTLGDSEAPITVIEYASMTCPHCAKFHRETFGDIKKEYIDTGKVYWVLREFPLDKLALKASMMARCVAPSMYFNLVEVLFNSQSRWIESDAPMQALEKTGRLAGMTPELFKECTENTELEMHVLKNMQTGQNQWAVKATPTFIINYGEERASGALKFEEFKEIFDKLLQKQGAK